jgi:signal transduction histidine kinase/CheY-like chemotaxis protein
MQHETPPGTDPSPAERAPDLGRANTWLLRFLPEAPPAGDELRRALVTAAVACLFAIVAPLYAVLGWLFEGPPLLYYGLAAITVTACTSALVLLKRGRYGAASWLLLLTGTAATLTTVLQEGAGGSAAGNLVLPVVMAALLFGRRGALGLGLPSLALIMTLAALEKAGLFHGTTIPHTFGLFGIVQIGSVLVMLVVFDGVRQGLVRAQHQLEEQLGRSRRLEAVGRVAGGIAHDFNNLLTVILANASLLADAQVPPPNDESVDEIRGAAKRGAQLTKQLLAFARQQRLDPRSFDLGALVAGERAMLSRLIPETITIAVERPPEPVWVNADPGQISQVLMNLVVNARDAMPEGGRLHIAVTAGAHGMHALTVRDTGAGMDTQTLERAFEPFFTTKGAVGTGLGLATVHGIVTQSGGQVRVRSGGGGTVFEVLLPTAEAPKQPVHRESSDELPRSRARTVLLVEDDAAVRAATTRLLESLGHRVVAHGDTAGALAAWRAAPAAIDLILSDVVMPGGGGPELVRALPSGHAARVVFMSGYANDAFKDAALAHVPFIAKPFTQKDLARKLEEVLGAPPPS